MTKKIFPSLMSMQYEALAKAALIAVLLGSGVVVAQFSEPNIGPTGNNVDSINVGSAKQVKTGGLWARAFVTDSPGGKLCLDKGGAVSDTNCISTWTDQLKVPRCRLESSQVIAGSGFTTSIGNFGCDPMTTPASKALGWTNTGWNVTSRVASSDGQYPSICVFMRLMCENLPVTPATSTIHTTWPIPNFSKSTNQCSDLVENETTLSKMADPPALAGPANGVSYATTSPYLAVAHNISPYISIYKRTGNTYTLLSGATGPIGGLPTSHASGVAFTQDDSYLAVAHMSSPYVTIYRKDASDVFTKIAGPAVPPAGHASSTAFSSDGKYLAVAHQTSPYVTIYRRSGASGETFTKLGNPATLPTGVGRSVSFSLDGTYLTVVHDTTPFVTVYKISVGDVLTKLPNPTVLPAGNGRGVNWLTNTSFNIVHAGSPYVRQYYVNNADGSDVPNADDSVAEYASQYASLTAITQRGGVDDYSGAPGGLFAAPDSKTVMSTDSSPYIHAYISACSGKFCSPLVWNKLPNPSPLPSAGNGISISPDGLHIAIVTNTSPYISIYKFPDGLIDYPADPECGSWWDNTEGASEATIACSDSVDNDADGFIDFQSDPGCTAASDATE